ncbi:hypothetical protein AACH06_05830 [Ideonella sp. DXS29W]|uniref:Uncharacterized protein n=1 Tax=Ideonella lacteola TaxID=2984193 RepID=A0ABU9BK48_9BURK
MTHGIELDEPPFGHQPPPLEPASFPRRYRARLRWKVVAAAILLAGLVLVYFHPAAWLLALLGALCTLDALRREIVLRVDAIEVQGMLRHRVIAVGQIEGVRTQPQPYGMRAVTRLVVARADGGSMRLDGGWESDAAFEAWLARLPDLDEINQRAARDAIVSDPAWGDATDERWPRWQRWHATTRVAVLVLSALVIASVFWRRDLEAPLFAVALLPLILLAAVSVSSGRLRLDSSPSDLRPSLYGLLLLSSAALAIRQFSEVTLEHWAAILPATALLGALLVAWAWRLSPGRMEDAQRWPMIPVLVVYASAVLVLLDTRLDNDRGHADPAVVLAKHFSGGHWRLFSVDVSPLDVHANKRTYNVSLATYNNVSPGETVCVRQHPGRFGWAWTDIQPCSGAAVSAGTGAWPDPLYRALVLNAYTPERRGPLLKLLFAAQYDELDTRLSDLQRRFERREIGSMDVLVAYRDFYDPNPELDTLFDAWVAGHPQSYGARLARGIHRKFQATALHRAGFEKWVSPSANVEAVVDKQIEELEQSIALTAQPILSYVHLMDAANDRRDRQQMRQWLDRGLAVEPGSLALTRKYMALLGQERARDEFLAECRAAGMPTATLNTLEAMALVRRAQNLRHDKSEDAALALARQAIALEPFADDLTMALYEAAWILARQGQHQAAVDLLERAVRTSPTDGSVHALMASSLWRLGRRDESLQQVREAAELGWAPSQAYLGESLLKGQEVPQDEVEARQWLSKAAAAGNERARQLLRDHPSPR